MPHFCRTIVIGSLCLTAATLAGTSPNASAKKNGNPIDQNDNDGGLPLRDQFELDFPGGQLLLNNGHLRRVWGRQFSTGASPHDSAEKFIKKWSGLWGVPFSQLVATGPFQNGEHLVPLMGTGDGEETDFIGAYWSQQVRGVPVFRSYVWGLVGVQDNFPLVLAGGTLKTLGNFPATMTDRDLSPQTLDASVYGREVLNQFNAPPELTTPRYVIFAGVDANTVETKLAIEFVATGGSSIDPDNYQKMQFVVDAETGAILHQESMILHGTVTAQVNALATPGSKAAACTTATLRGMPYIKATIGGSTVYADKTGRIVHTYSGTSSQTVAPVLQGQYFTVQDAAATIQVVSSQSVADGATGTFQFPSTTNQYTQSEIDTYTSANAARDFLLVYSPNYPTIKTQTGFVIKNNVSGTCNAFYDGSINFYPTGGGCNNTGFSSIVHHEYGHHIVSAGGSGQNQYGEGFGDVVSIVMGDESMLGYGFQSCSSGLRNAQNTCVGSATGSTCGTAIHSWGQVLSGCFWDLRNQLQPAYPTDASGNGTLDYRDRLASLAFNSVPLHAGQSDIWTDITVDVLTLDDAVSNGGNNFIGDGSPNYTRISTAFGNHGLTAPPLNLLTITVGTVPTTVSPEGGDQIDVTITPVTGVVQNGTQKLFIRTGTSGSFTGYALTSTGGNNYKATFPAASCNALLQFYVEAKTTTGGTVTSPSTAPASLLTTTAISPGGTVALLNIDFAANNGSFAVAGTPAVGSGGWEWAVPSGRSCNAPSTSSKAFITGVSAATGLCNDLDGGPTYLTSPSFDASAAEACEVLYQTYYLTSPTSNTSDPMVVQVSNNGGSTWVQIGSYATTGTWTSRNQNLGDYVTLTNNMKVRFIAQDTGTDNTVVCGIDNFVINTISCTQAKFGDLDGDSIVGSGDLSLMLLDFGPCPGCPADLDESGDVDNGDIALLLLSYD